MTLTNITIDIGSGTSIIGPEFWAHSGYGAKIISMVCGIAVAVFLVATLAAKWLSRHWSNQASSTAPVELTDVVSGGEPSNREPAPAAGTTSEPAPLSEVGERR
ncbi:hypothetical protein BGX38DRAFT_1260300 [Terfezia claveryi]|nr:hypothetical protein BGX38DRAFT_1260300 [Terfezia claveryi]